MQHFKIGVFGLGFVGLTTVLGLLRTGTQCGNTQINSANGIIPFFEAGLSKALEKALGDNLKVTTNIRPILKCPRCFNLLYWHTNGQ